MDGFEDFLDNEAGKGLPDLYAPIEGAQATDIAAPNTDDAPPADAPIDQKITPEVVTPAAPVVAPEGNQTTTDHGKLLEEISGGRVKGKEDFQSILQKADKAEELQGTIDAWKAKYGENPYADSFEETRNMLKKQGATENQLKQLDEINSLGELKDLSPLEIRVKAMVLRDNVSPKIAERMIKEEVGLTEFLGDDDKEYVETKLAISAKADLKYLEEFKDKLKPVDNSTVQIQREAAVTQAKEALKPVSSEMQKGYAEIKDFDITGGKKPEDIINFTLKTPEAFTSVIPQLVEQYIVQTGRVVDEKSIADANEYIETLMWGKHGKEFLRTAVNHAIATTTEKLTNKYENRTSLTDDQRSAPVTEDMDDFYREVAS